MQAGRPRSGQKAVGWTQASSSSPTMSPDEALSARIGYAESMRGKWLTLLVLVLCGGLLAWRHGPPFPKTDPDDENGAVWLKLHQSVDLSSDPFKEGDIQASVALAKLSRYLGIPITIDPGLEKLTKFATIQWPKENMTAMELIDWILVQAASGASPVVKDGQLSITMRDSKDTSLYVGQVHLLPADLLAITGESSELFAEAIQNIVTPDLWADVGGTAEIRAIPCALAVAHRYDVQQQIARLLDVIADAHRHPERLDPIRVTFGDTRASNRMQKKLDQVVSYTATDAGLREVVGQLQAEYDVPILLDRQSLLEQGLDLDLEVTIDLENVSLRFLLEQILKPHSLSVEPGDSFLIITSEDKVLSRLSTTVVYPVGDLVRAHKVVDVLIQMVSPNDWADVGGDAMIASCGNTVVVAHSNEGHAQVADLLRRWRAIRQADDVELDRVNREPRDEHSEVLERLVSVRAHDELLELWLRRVLEEQGLSLVYDRSDSDAEFAISNAFNSQRVTCDADPLPLWHVLESVLAPLKLQIVHGDGRTMLLTTIDNSVHEGTVRIYNVEALVGPRADAVRQEALLDEITESIAVDSWSDVGGEGEIEIIEKALFVRHGVATQRAVLSLLDRLIQIPDQPDSFGVLADKFEPQSVIDDLRGRTLVTRVYYFPSSFRSKGRESGMSVAGQIREELFLHVTGEASADIGGFATAELVTVDDREVIVISHTMAGHNKIQHYLDSMQLVDRPDVPPSQSASWQHVDLAGDQRTAPARLSYRSVDDELTLLERWGIKSQDPNQMDSSERLHEFLASGGRDWAEMPEEDQRSTQLYLRQRLFHVIADNETSAEVERAQIDSLLQTLHQVDQEVTLQDDTHTEERCQRLVTMMMEDADENRRHVAAFILRCMTNGSILNVSDAAVNCIRRHLAGVQDPVICRTVLQMLPVAKDRAEPLFAPLLQAMPGYSLYMQAEVIQTLGSAGPAAVPYLCELTNDVTINRRAGSEAGANSAIRALRSAAGESNESAIRTIIDAHVFAPMMTQKAIAAIFPDIDPTKKMTRSLIDEFSQRPDARFQESWIVFREQILLKLGDPE